MVGGALCEAFKGSVDPWIGQQCKTHLYYKNGEVSTGIEILDIASSINDDNQLEILTDFLRTGNSPFLGSVNVSLQNSRGETVREATVSTTYFFDGVHKQTFDIEDLPAGNYNINIEFISQRDDISANDIVQMPKVTESATYTIRWIGNIQKYLFLP